MYFYLKFNFFFFFFFLCYFTEVRTRWSEIKSSQNWYTNIIFNKDYKYINFIKFRSADAAVVNTNYFSEKKLHKLLKIFYIYVNIWNVQIVLKIIIFCIKNIKNSKITIYILFKNIYFINNLCNFRIEGKSIQNRHFGKITKKFWANFFYMTLIKLFFI